MENKKNGGEEREPTQEIGYFRRKIRNLSRKLPEIIQIFKQKVSDIKSSYNKSFFPNEHEREKSIEDHVVELLRDVYEVLKRDPRIDEEADHLGANTEDLRLIEAVEKHDFDNIVSLIESGINVNARDRDGMTALHHAGAMGLRDAIRALVNSGRCDYLIKDNEGRYASEMALEWSSNYAIIRLLIKKQAKQAYLMGVPAWDKED